MIDYIKNDGVHTKVTCERAVTVAVVSLVLYFDLTNMACVIVAILLLLKRI